MSPNEKNNNPATVDARAIADEQTTIRRPAEPLNRRGRRERDARIRRRERRDWREQQRQNA